MNQLQSEAYAYLAAIIASSDDAIISKDLHGNITSWNPGAQRIFGYTSDEVVGRHITLLIPGDRLSEEEQILSRLRKGERIEHFETVRRHKDGHLIPISLTVSPIRDATGTIVGASKISRDISERMAAEAALKEMGRKKDEFLANMSHELRTPMNAVVGLANLLKNSDTLSTRDRKFVETLKISADNLMDLINDLLDFAKIESDSIQLEEIPFNLAEEVEKVIQVSSVRAREKQLGLYVNYLPGVPRDFLGDPLRVRQILMNLVSNAVKFTNRGSVQLDISSAAHPNLPEMTMLTVRVKDTGIGIDPGKLPIIFDKFIQADSSITRRYGGSGLGLAITKALAEHMGGAIDVESQPGVGTIFTVHFALRNTVQKEQPDTFSVCSAPERQIIHKQILLVEDYQPNILVAGAVLEELGYSYDIANNGFEAIQKFMQNSYNLILMDLQMHELDGLEATRRIRELEKEKQLGRIPIIAMTAHVREQDKESCLEAGMDDFVAKPFEQAYLLEKMIRHIKPTPKKSDQESKEFA